MKFADPGGNTVISSLMRDEDLSVCASLTSRRHQSSSLGLADVPAHRQGLADVPAQRQGLAGLCPQPVLGAASPHCPSDQDTLLLPALCFAGQSEVSKTSRDVLTSGTNEANSCEIVFGQDSGGTPNRAGPPSSYTPHTFSMCQTPVCILTLPCPPPGSPSP